MKKEMLIFSYDFPPLEGGISRLCDAIAKEFINHDWKVKGLSVRFDIKKGYKEPEYFVERVTNKRIFREISSFFRLLKFPKDILIITDVWHPEGWIAMLAGHKNVVIVAHGNDVMTGKKNLKNTILNFMRKIFLNKAKLVICNSNYTASIVKSQIKSANVKVCTLGVDPEKFKPLENKNELKKKFDLPEDKKIILTVSRINKYKAHDVVLKAISLLKEDEKNEICYCIAGRGNHLEELKKLAKNLNIDKYVKWLGFVDEDDLPLLYNASDLFVLCTREEKDEKAVEGFGLVFLEAQSCGIPVVGVKQGGIPDAVKENNGGWLIERDDTEALAKIFKELIINPEKFKSEGQKARKRVLNEATWKHFSKKVFEEINKLKEV